MIRVKRRDNVNDTIRMNQMKPYDIGMEMENGCTVMRTANPDKIEVMDLSNPSLNSSYYNENCETPVRLFPKGYTIILEVV